MTECPKCGGYLIECDDHYGDIIICCSLCEFETDPDDLMNDLSEGEMLDMVKEWVT